LALLKSVDAVYEQKLDDWSAAYTGTTTSSALTITTFQAGQQIIGYERDVSLTSSSTSGTMAATLGSSGLSLVCSTGNSCTAAFTYDGILTSGIMSGSLTTNTICLLGARTIGSATVDIYFKFITGQSGTDYNDYTVSSFTNTDTAASNICFNQGQTNQYGAGVTWGNVREIELTFTGTGFSFSSGSFVAKNWVNFWLTAALTDNDSSVDATIGDLVTYTVYFSLDKDAPFDEVSPQVEVVVPLGLTVNSGFDAAPCDGDLLQGSDSQSNVTMTWTSITPLIPEAICTYTFSTTIASSLSTNILQTRGIYSSDMNFLYSSGTAFTSTQSWTRVEIAPVASVTIGPATLAIYQGDSTWSSNLYFVLNRAAYHGQLTLEITSSFLEFDTNNDGTSDTASNAVAILTVAAGATSSGNFRVRYTGGAVSGAMIFTVRLVAASGDSNLNYLTSSYQTPSGITVVGQPVTGYSVTTSDTWQAGATEWSNFEICLMQGSSQVSVKGDTMDMDISIPAFQFLSGTSCTIQVDGSCCTFAAMALSSATAGATTITITLTPGQFSLNDVTGAPNTNPNSLTVTQIAITSFQVDVNYFPYFTYATGGSATYDNVYNPRLTLNAPAVNGPITLQLSSSGGYASFSPSTVTVDLGQTQSGYFDFFFPGNTPPGNYNIVATVVGGTGNNNQLSSTITYTNAFTVEQEGFSEIVVSGGNVLAGSADNFASPTTLTFTTDIYVAGGPLLVTCDSTQSFTFSPETFSIAANSRTGTAAVSVSSDREPGLVSLSCTLSGGSGFNNDLNSDEFYVYISVGQLEITSVSSDIQNAGSIVAGDSASVSSSVTLSLGQYVIQGPVDVIPYTESGCLLFSRSTIQVPAGSMSVASFTMSATDSCAPGLYNLLVRISPTVTNNNLFPVETIFLTTSVSVTVTQLPISSLTLSCAGSLVIGGSTPMSCTGVVLNNPTTVGTVSLALSGTGLTFNPASLVVPVGSTQSPSFTISANAAAVLGANIVSVAITKNLGNNNAVTTPLTSTVTTQGIPIQQVGATSLNSNGKYLVGVETDCRLSIDTAAVGGAVYLTPTAASSSGVLSAFQAALGSSSYFTIASGQTTVDTSVTLPSTVSEGSHFVTFTISAATANRNQMPDEDLTTTSFLTEKTPIATASISMQTLAPGTSTSVTVTLQNELVGGGAVFTITDNSADVTFASTSVTVAAGASSFTMVVIVRSDVLTAGAVNINLSVAPQSGNANTFPANSAPIYLTGLSISGSVLNLSVVPITLTAGALRQRVDFTFDRSIAGACAYLNFPSVTGLTVYSCPNGACTTTGTTVTISAGLSGTASNANYFMIAAQTSTSPGPVTIRPYLTGCNGNMNVFASAVDLSGVIVIQQIISDAFVSSLGRYALLGVLPIAGFVHLDGIAYGSGIVLTPDADPALTFQPPTITINEGFYSASFSVVVGADSSVARGPFSLNSTTAVSVSNSANNANDMQLTTATLNLEAIGIYGLEDDARTDPITEGAVRAKLSFDLDMTNNFVLDTFVNILLDSMADALNCSIDQLDLVAIFPISESAATSSSITTAAVLTAFVVDLLPASSSSSAIDPAELYTRLAALSSLSFGSANSVTVEAVNIFGDSTSLSDSSDDQGLSAGAVAGIVIGILAIGAAGAYYVLVVMPAAGAAGGATATSQAKAFTDLSTAKDGTEMTNTNVKLNMFTTE